MSIYSYTRLDELSSAYISTRTRNICRNHKILTVKDVWDRYVSRRNFRSISQIGKKAEMQLLRITRKAAEVMSVMPLTVSAEAPAWTNGFSLVALYHSLDEEGKRIADNVYTRFAGRLRATGQQKLIELCGDLTLASFLHTMNADARLFQTFNNNPGLPERGGTNDTGFIQVFSKRPVQQVYGKAGVNPAAPEHASTNGACQLGYGYVFDDPLRIAHGG